MSDARRISAGTARTHVMQGDALLVCGYDDDQKCEKLSLPGAISFSELETRLPRLAKDQEIIFYCT